MKTVLFLGIAAALTFLLGCTPAGGVLESDSTHYGATAAEGTTAKSAQGAAAGPAQGSPAAAAPVDVAGPAHGALGPAMGASPHGQSEAPLSRTISLAGLTLTAPEAFKPQEPANMMIAQEFAVEPVKGDSRPGRLTVMMAGGSVEANVARWKGQFKQPDGSSTDNHSKVEKKTLAGHAVHVADISGTYAESAGMMAPAVDRPDYRMLAAIVPLDSQTLFIKFYGPKNTVAAHEKDFSALLESLK